MEATIENPEALVPAFQLDRVLNQGTTRLRSLSPTFWEAL